MTAASSFKLRLDGQSQYDNALLVQILDALNRRHFDNQIQADVRWEIPSGSVAVFTGINAEAISTDSPLHCDFITAQALLQNNNVADALPLLLHSADRGHQEAHLLANHILKRLGDPRWPEYVKRYNQYQDSHRAIPAACYYPDTRLIAIHPYVYERKAPQLVLKYLVYHECCHQLIPSENNSPHPPEFMEWEYRAPSRTRALEWLAKEGFPTLPATPTGA